MRHSVDDIYQICRPLGLERNLCHPTYELIKPYAVGKTSLPKTKIENEDLVTYPFPSQL